MGGRKTRWDESRLIALIRNEFSVISSGEFTIPWNTTLESDVASPLERSKNTKVAESLAPLKPVFLSNSEK
jgi:hypothetical protein